MSLSKLNLISGNRNPHGSALLWHGRSARTGKFTRQLNELVIRNQMARHIDIFTVELYDMGCLHVKVKLAEKGAILI
jgi:hypothetical protein